MRKLKWLFLLMVMFLADFAQGQIYSPYPYGYNRYPYSRTPYGNVPFVTYESSGQYFINEEWLDGKVILKDGKTVEGYPLRYDLENNRLEVKLDDAIHPLELKQIKSFEWYHPESKLISLYVNAFDYKLDGVPLVGVYEVLYDGPVKLFSKKDVNVYNSSYVTGYNSIRMRESASKEHDFFFAKGNEVFKVEKSYKENLHVFEPHGSEIGHFIKKQKLKMKKPEDLVAVIQHYESLVSN